MTETIILIILAFLPGLVWLWFYYARDYHREPTKPLLKIFCAGMALTFPVVFLEYALVLFFPALEAAGWFWIIINSFLGIAAVEEMGKYLLVRLTAYRQVVFDEPVDGVVYAIAAAVGFATVENILAVASGGGTILALRAVTATLLHVGAAGIMGFCLGHAKFHHHARIRWQLWGVLFATLVHGLYNFIVATLDSSLFWWLAALLMFLFFLLAVLMKLAQPGNVAKNERP